ncbi:MAG: hypothetical protein V4692_11585 [Bdellovibrionota bacterium]
MTHIEMSHGGRVLKILLAGLLVVISGCSQPLDVGDVDQNSVTAKKTTFAYDANIDQLAFMSCPHYELNQVPNGNDYNRPYFTFRAGAYRSAGIQLKDSFFDELGAKPLDLKAEILTKSPQNAATVLQLAIRNRQDKQTLYRNGDLTKGQDYFNVFAPLGDPGTSKALVYNPVGNRMKHMRNGRAGGLRLEGDLTYTSLYNFPGGSADPGGVVRALSGTMLLGLTYVQSGAAGMEYVARSPAYYNGGTDTEAKTNVYGVGYEISFTKPGSNSSHPESVMYGVREVSLSNEALPSQGTWDCNPSLRFRIVRPNEAVPGGTANCVKKPDPSVLDDTFKTIRNSLRVEDWYVDYQNKCVISKKGELCYKPTDVVVYPSGDSCQTNGTSTCVAYVSICQRR